MLQQFYQKYEVLFLDNKSHLAWLFLATASFFPVLSNFYSLPIELSLSLGVGQESQSKNVKFDAFMTTSLDHATFDTVLVYL